MASASNAAAIDGNDKINNLQLVRAAAALLVAYVHTGYSLGGLRPFGKFGVDIFFVLSGFIMAGISGRGTDAFFRRRLVRIVPPYWFFTLAVFAVALAAPTLLNSTEADPVHLLKSLFFIPFRKSNGAMQPILFLGWTLNYEMFFYAVVSLSLATGRKHTLAITSLILLSWMAACYPFRHHNDLAEFYSDPKMLEFILGLVAFRIYARGGGRSRLLAVVHASCVVGALGLMILIEGLGPAALGLRRDVTGISPQVAGQLATGLLAFLLILSTSLLSKGGFDARPGVLVLIGNASYILYLIHPYIEIGFAKVVGKWLPSFSLERSLPAVLLLLAIVSFVAVVIHLYVERPVTSALSRRLIPRRRPAAPPAPSLNDGVVPSHS